MRATNTEFETEINVLIQESDELKKIFSAILEKSSLTR